MNDTAVPSLSSAVPSTVRWSDGRACEDTNGFITALAVRELRQSGQPVPGTWLDFLGSCARPEGGYGFWPVGGTPAWAPDLPPDADDTAVMLLELTCAGRVSREEARRTACVTVGSHRLVRVLDPGPPWLRRGMFTTWHRPGRAVGTVDVTALTNVLALLYALDLSRIPGVAESVDGLRAAVGWAGTSPARWRSVSPFYPEPDELARALDHAAQWGVPDAESWAHTVRTVCPRESGDAICSMAYGPPTWHSPSLLDLRRHGGTDVPAVLSCADEEGRRPAVAGTADLCRT